MSDIERDNVIESTEPRQMLAQSFTGDIVQRASHNSATSNLIVSPFESRESFELVQRMATLLSNASIIPNEYRCANLVDGKWVDNPDAIGNCFIAIELASRLNLSPLVVMQNVDVIHGRPGLRGTMLIALINRSREFTDLVFENNGKAGDEFGWRLRTTSRETGNEKLGTWITWAMVKAEGWDSKKGSKWKTMPEQMFQYRAAAFWSRLHAPHITLGLMESDELHDMSNDAPSISQARVDSINRKLDALPDNSNADKAPDRQEPPATEPTKEAGPRRKSAKRPPEAKPEPAVADDAKGEETVAESAAAEPNDQTAEPPKSSPQADAFANVE